MALVLIHVVVMLGLVAGWLRLLGNLSTTLFDGVHTLSLELWDPVREKVALGSHDLVAHGPSAVAGLYRATAELRLFDVAAPTFYGVRLLEMSSWAAALVALHLVDRIVLQTRAGEPFVRDNARRCLRIGWWMTASFVLGLVTTAVQGVLVSRADVAGLQMFAAFVQPGIEWAPLVFAFCGFCAGALLRYGADLEDEQALTV